MCFLLLMQRQSTCHLPFKKKNLGFLTTFYSLLTCTRRVRCLCLVPSFIKKAAQISMPMKNYDISVSMHSRRCSTWLSFPSFWNPIFLLDFVAWDIDRFVSKNWSLASLHQSSTYLSGAVTEVHWLLWKGKMETSVFCWLSHYIDWFLMPSCYFWCRNRHPNSNRISNTSYSIKSYFLLLPVSKNCILAHAPKNYSCPK